MIVRLSVLLCLIQGQLYSRRVAQILSTCHGVESAHQHNSVAKLRIMKPCLPVVTGTIP